MRRAALTLAAAALALAGCQTLTAPTDHPGPAVDILAHDLTITPDFKRRSLTGRQSVTLRSLANGTATFAFSANALTIDRATLDGQALALTTSGDVLTIALPRPLAAGETVTLNFAWHGRPRRGVVFANGAVYTSYFTCDWMLCAQDQPGDKAAITLTLLLPPGMTSLGPGTRIAAVPTGKGQAQRWRAERPYSAYTYGFAAGRFAAFVQPAGDLEITTYSAVAGPKALLARYATTLEMVAFFSEKAGLPLQHPYAQLHVAGDEAQESVGFSVIGEAAIGPILADPQEDWAIAHELAHQWWGNLVTCTDWSQFWLNEGVTTYMVAAWKEHKWGRAAYDREMELLRARVAKAAAKGVDEKLTFPGPYPSLGLKRAIVYSKGALFLDALRTELGDAAFWAGLKDFTVTHAGGTVTSKDFQAAMEKAAGRSLAALFTAWVY